MKINNIRNFCIIAHIDHGKSTLADRVIDITRTVDKRKMREQFLDDMDIERERGITIKSRAVRMEYKHPSGIEYQMNLIDTPGHVDFSYEVSRSLAACEGAVLVIDASQGVEAQTLANIHLAQEAGLVIIPVLNKTDLPQSDIEGVTMQAVELGFGEDEIQKISAKTGRGVPELINRIIEKIPPPKGDINVPPRALIFDSVFDNFLGSIAYVRVMDGSLNIGDEILMIRSGQCYEINEIGIFKPDKVKVDKLLTGEVGYIAASIKDVSHVQIGDTVTLKKNPAGTPLKGYKPIKPFVFCGMYSSTGEDFDKLRDALQKLHLNDPSYTFFPETSNALGYGFRCGFLGILHMEIIQERLEREFEIDLITTSPNVAYEVLLKNGKIVRVDKPNDLPPMAEIEQITEPYIRSTVVLPAEYLGNVMKLSQDKRGTYKEMNYISKKRVLLLYEFPLSEVILDFYNKLKSCSRGYASMDYEHIGYRPGKLKKLDILINGEPVDALSMIIHRDKAATRGRMLAKKLKEIIPRQLFAVPIQAAIGSKIIARETLPAVRKDVTAKCYGGDITRKRKLLEKQKKGKKRLKRVGKVDIPQEGFMAILSIED